jgi:hypothetical protein
VDISEEPVASVFMFEEWAKQKRNQRENRYEAKLCLAFNRLQGFIRRKIGIFMTTAVRTSYATFVYVWLFVLKIAAGGVFCCT